MTTLHYSAPAGRVYLPYIRYLRRLLPDAVAKIPRSPKEVSIVLVGDRKMAELHKKFLGIDGPTDVLTFELEHDRRGRCIDGEIVICVTHANRQARERGTDSRDEILLYALHGVLHLSGHDDRTTLKYRKMHEAEDRILQAIGVGKIFNGDRISEGTGLAKKRGSQGVKESST